MKPRTLPRFQTSHFSLLKYLERTIPALVCFIYRTQHTIVCLIRVCFVAYVVYQSMVHHCIVLQHTYVLLVHISKNYAEDLQISIANRTTTLIISYTVQYVDILYCTYRW